MPKNIIRLERLFDLQDKFKRPMNTKISRSSLRCKVVNLSIEHNLQTINLGTNYTHAERATFMILFKEYKDVFTWTYEYFKAYDTKIIQHIIPLKKDAKPFQQKLRNMNPSLDMLVKNELNKFLATKIILSVQHTT